MSARLIALPMSDAAADRLPADVSEGTGQGWRLALLAMGAALLAVLALYRDTAESMAAIWMRSETFSHGFVVVPIVLALLWLKRHALRALQPRPDVLGYVLLACAGAAWLAGAAGGVLVLQQLAFTAMFPAIVIAVAGRGVAWAAAFPLAYLFFAVPVGEALIAPLMDWTALFTETALRLTQVPVHREGLFLTLPSGQWSVVEGCSGLRYLIASAAAGSLYAYISYRGMRKRLLFFLLALIVPIVANGLRAYMIIMIAHLSDMRLALGVDHLIYGWVFFGFVMALLFWLGSFGRDTETEAPSEVPAALRSVGRPGALASAAICSAALAAAWPLYAAQWTQGDAAGSVALAAPAGAAGWREESSDVTQWRPKYDRPSASLYRVYRNGDQAVALYIAYYRDQRQGAELVNSQNVMVVQKHATWASVGEVLRTEHLDGFEVALRETSLRSRGQKLLVWDWLAISGRNTSNPYFAKALIALDRLLGRRDDGAAIVLAASHDGEPAAAQTALRQFLRDMRPSIDAALAAAMAGSH